MRKAFFTNFQFFFLLIFFLHLSVLFLHWQETREEKRKEAVTQLKVRVLREFEAKRQIVESEDPLEETTPKDHYRLSDKDRAFDRETKARIVDSFRKSSRGQRGAKDLTLSALGGEIAGKNPFEKAAKQYAQKKSGANIESGGRTVSSTNDHLEDVPLGDLTHLNTIEYKFFGYYHRIRQKLEGFWGRSIQEKAEALAAKGRSLASNDQLVTALRIVMDAEGEIVDVAILGSSGVKELDDAAIESFNAAGPFPNPPKDLIVDGRVTIEWGFVVNS